MIGRNAALSRRALLRGGLYGLGAGLALPGVLGRSAWARAAEALAAAPSHSDRILVVVEMAGGNDGLNTVVPYRQDAYYEARPNIAVPKEQVLRLDDEVGLHPVLQGLRNVWERGELAIVEGCGYPDPSRSHFTSMEYWHTARPHAGEARGWIGRVADAQWGDAAPGTVVNIAERQSLAVASARHSPLVFSDPQRFVRRGPEQGEAVFERLVAREDGADGSLLGFVRGIARTAQRSSREVRAAVAGYETPISYGAEGGDSLAPDLKKVAALIAAGFPTRVFYVSIGGFDTHSGQAQGQRTPLMYTSDALEGFLADVRRLGRADDVAVLVFTEFGRRVAENRSGGTDHGAATPMYLLGAKVRGGRYGIYPSLEELDPNGDLVMTLDFRSVYASVIRDWLGIAEPRQILGEEFPTLSIFS